MWWEPSLPDQSQGPGAVSFPTFPLPFHCLPFSYPNFPSWWSFRFFSCPHSHASVFTIFKGCKCFQGLHLFSRVHVLSVPPSFLIPPPYSSTHSHALVIKSLWSPSLCPHLPFTLQSLHGLLLPPFLWNYFIIGLNGKIQDFFNPHLIWAPQHLSVLIISFSLLSSWLLLLWSFLLCGIWLLSLWLLLECCHSPGLCP